MVPFAGYNMPVQYEGVTLEHLCVRSGVGVFDVSHMGEFFVRGKGASNFIQKITSNDEYKEMYEEYCACLDNLGL